MMRGILRRSSKDDNKKRGRLAVQRQAGSIEAGRGSKGRLAATWQSSGNMAGRQPCRRQVGTFCNS
jgi:hypothetical protein